MTRESPLAIFLIFLRFGMLAWGGPVAQIAMVKRELVDEREWVDRDRFTRLLAAYQVLPGPEAHELCVHFGTIRGGRIGGVAAGLGFMFPGFLLVLTLAAAYRAIDLSQPLLVGALVGMQVAVLALIARAVHRIGNHVVDSHWGLLIALGAFTATMAGASFWFVLPAAGILYVLEHWRWRVPTSVAAFLALLATISLQLDVASKSQGEGMASLALLFAAGLKAGLLTFGGAYTAIPFVRDDTVGRGWLDDTVFLDSLALSGVMPAPLVIFVTFVGYQIAGLGGALAMTAGMFLPAFGFTLLFFERIEQLAAHKRLTRFLEGVACAVVGIIGATLVSLAAALVPRLQAPIAMSLLFVASLVLLYRMQSKLVALHVVALGALAGMIATAL